MKCRFSCMPSRVRCNQAIWACKSCFLFNYLISVVICISDSRRIPHCISCGWPDSRSSHHRTQLIEQTRGWATEKVASLEKPSSKGLPSCDLIDRPFQCTSSQSRCMSTCKRCRDPNRSNSLRGVACRSTKADFQRTPQLLLFSET